MNNTLLLLELWGGGAVRGSRQPRLLVSDELSSTALEQSPPPPMYGNEGPKLAANNGERIFL